MLDASVKLCFLAYFVVILSEPVSEFVSTMNDILSRL
jgi:hypothetical protein